MRAPRLPAVSLVALMLSLPSWLGAQAQTFPNPHAPKDAERLEAQIKVQVPALAKGTKQQTPAALKQTGDKLLADGKDPRSAARTLMQAVSANPGDGGAWLSLARAVLAITPDTSKGEQYEYPAYASGAAYRAYEQATTPVAKAEALVVMVEGLKRRTLWRPAIETLKAALALNETAEMRDAYDKLRLEHGFRMVDYKIDADSAEPRLCLNFSERLAGQPADLAKFLAVDSRDPQSVSGDGRQLCAEGLQHGKRYVVQLRSGLPSDTGEQIQKSVELAAYVRDRAPSVRFTGRAYVLPNRGQQGIPVVTVNTAKVAVEIFRIGDRGLAGVAGGENFLKQLQAHEIDQVRENHGQHVWKGTLDVTPRQNEDVTTALPVSEALPKLEPGVYVVSARLPKLKSTDAGNDADDDGSSHDKGRTSQWFIVSDLGLTALSGEDGVHGFVRSLASADPVAGVTVRLVARNNEVLGTTKSDATGYVRFDAGLKRGEGGQAPALLVAETAQDYAFLDLATTAFDLTDRGVKGRETPGALDAYLYSERGVYRPGETVNLTGLVRDRAGLAANLPVTLIIARPDGVEHRRIALGDQGLGGRTTALALGGGVMTGTWRVKLHADPKADPLAQVSFLVEDFLPERLDLKLEPQAKTIQINEAAKIVVYGRYLYGPPAAGLDMEGEIVVRPATADLEGFAGYRFGRSDERITAVRRPLEELPKTDAQGRAELLIALPAVPRTARPLEADVLIKLRESGGRTIERRIVLPVSLGEARVGVRSLFTDNTVGIGESATFDVITLGPDGKQADAKQFRWELSRLDTRWQWYHRDGQWNYETLSTARRITQGTADASDGKPARIEAKVDYGRYRLDVTTGDTGGPKTSVTFNSGWHASDNIESPETLEVALDKASYKAGETARLKITSKESGKAQIAVLAGGVLATKQIDVPAGGVEVPIEVKGEWLPGAYVTATLFRSLDEKARRMPGRAIGVKWLGLDTSGHTLKVAMTSPAKVRPGTRLDVPIKVQGLNAGDEARITVAAVDVGILNLTRFESPQPEKWFHAQRRLGTEIRDFYGRLIDGMRAERGRLRSGGDGAGGMSMKGSPPVEAPLSLFSGVVKVGTDGTATVGFDLPDFNGTVRLMAVAWSGGKVGSGQADVIVRDQLALTASGPRFLTFGDTARLEIDIHNVEGGTADYKLGVEHENATGAKTSLPGRDVALKSGERRRERVELKPTELGRMTYDVRVTGPGGIDVKRRLAFDVKPPAADIRRATVASLAPKGGRLAISKDLLADFIPGTARISMIVGPAAAMDVGSLLGQLDRYPYGCAEQTTSRALPLLYVNEMSRRFGMAGDAEIRDRVQKAVERVFEMQDAAGAFGIWGPHMGGDLWLSAYVTDFLTRAKETGYSVRAEPFARALDRLQNALGYAQDFENGGEARAYGLYVLARNGRAPIGDLRYDVDTRLEKFATPLAQAQLGAALAMLGEKERAERAFKVAVTRLEQTASTKDLDAARADYGSFVRDGAAVLTLASETSVAKAATPGLAGVLARVYRTRAYTSTQEQAWMLLAARALAEQARNTAITVNGLAHKGELMRAVTELELAAGPLTVVNDSDDAVDSVISVTGSALTPEPAAAKGFKIERRYYTLDGKEVELKSGSGGQVSLAQNERLVVVLKITGDEIGGRVLLVDRLPAGLEIENPRLVDGGDLKGLDWLKRVREPEHTEFRDDRFVAAFSFFEGGRRGSFGPSVAVEASVAYIVRAVTPGSFVHPAATVEDMYRPERFARTATGRLDVTEKK